MPPYTYEYAHPAFSVDVVLFAGTGDARKVLLVRRALEPFAGSWALPGGFVEEGELVEDAARRELAEETGIRWDGPLLQAGAFGDPGRDPRGWTVTICWTAWTGEEPLRVAAGDDAADARWQDLDDLPALAFDHGDIIPRAVEELRLRGEW